MTEQVVTRFAPSPTGFLHIGGARTALFNWLYARARGGQFLLRIEDTDRARSSEAAVGAIIEGLGWLGLEWDGEPIHQFARAARHREVAEAMLASGTAYRCYATPEELAEMREKARAEGRAPGYDGRWRDRDPSEAPAGGAYAVRLKAPRDGETVIEDRVQGPVVFANENLDDLVLLRSDGTPTYMLSVVVDDHDMGVTHVIRGDDHLTNAARQTQIFRAMGWTVPVFAHVPLIHGPDGAKFSKRHGAPGIEDYRAMGYLPAALRNYLVRLGWSHGDDEIMSSAEMLAWFDIDDVGRSAARFDFAKLGNLNGHYLRQTPDAEIVAQMRRDIVHYRKPSEAMADLPEALSEAHWSQLERAMAGLKERARTLVEILDNARYLYVERPLALDEAASRLLDGPAREMLGELAANLEEVADWRPETIEAAVKAFAEASSLKLGKVAQPLRAALTGRAQSPGIFDVLHVLGRQESIARVRDKAGTRS
ncbi:MAG: glutamate--tRNA ligase [Rhizobiales bacterium]|nr:glutamate--tRNA ligase [Hyphomicrobiales bacterium]